MMHCISNLEGGKLCVNAIIAVSLANMNLLF